MKKIKKLGLLLIVLFITTTTFAQKYGADSANCVRNLSLYKDYYKQKLYDDAITYWRATYMICPQSSEKMYIDGTNMFKRLIKKTKDADLKTAYIDTLLSIHDQRIQYFGKECKVLGRKGLDMLKYANNDMDAVFATLEKSMNGCGNKSEAGTIAGYMNAIVIMEKAGKKTPEDVVAAFTSLSDVLDHNLMKYKGKKTEEYYIRAQENVESLASPYLSCDVLIEMATKNYEEKKSDAKWMEKTTDLLSEKDCTDDPMFFTMAKEVHATKPSAASAEKMGIMSLKNKQYAEAEELFQQALDLAQDESKKVDYYIELAQAQSSRGKYGAARTNAKKAANLKPGYGLPYLMIGDMIAGSSSCGGEDACKQKAIYWLAVDYYNRAKSIDPSVAGKANQKIATYKKYFPTKEDCFFGGTKAGDVINIGCWIGESTKARF